jgi:hypothetical protein
LAAAAKASSAVSTMGAPGPLKEVFTHTPRRATVEMARRPGRVSPGAELLVEESQEAALIQHRAAAVVAKA